MLRLLLDEHISRAVAQGLRRQRAGLVVSLVAWEKGRLVGEDDAECLQAAAKAGLTLVTYDRRTIPPLLKNWAEEGRAHGGVIFVDEKTISPADVGGLVRALRLVYEKCGRWDWKDRILVLGQGDKVERAG